MKEYKLGIILGITITIWLVCFLFIPSCDPPEDPNFKMTMWKFASKMAIPMIIILFLYLGKRFIIPILT